MDLEGFGKSDSVAAGRRRQIPRLESRPGVGVEIASRVRVHQIVLYDSKPASKIVVGHAQFVERFRFTRGERPQQEPDQPLVIVVAPCIRHPYPL